MNRSTPAEAFYLNADGAVDHGPVPDGATVIPYEGDAPFSGRIVRAAALAAVLRLHSTWYGSRFTPTPVGVRANLDGANLDGANLVRANLDGASLVGARLYGASLDGANLDGANLVGANLDGARLVYARLDNVRLDGARLVYARLVYARLDGANLDGANLVGACLYGANLDGASLDGATSILSAGPLGVEGRTLYAVDHDDRVMVQAGCSWCTAAETIAKIEVRYADGTGREQHRAAYIAAVQDLEARLIAARETVPDEQVHSEA